MRPSYVYGEQRIMKLTKEAVKQARMALIDSVEIWMGGYDKSITKELVEVWTQAAKSNTSEDMSRVLQEGRFEAITLFDTCQNVNGSLSDEESETDSKPVPLTDKTWKLTVENGNSFMEKVCQLTTVIEYLFQLEAMLTPVDISREKTDSLKPILLAKTMADSIMNEWQYVEPGLDTFKHYSPRHKAVVKQLTLADEKTTASISMHNDTINKKNQQFKHAIECLASSLRDMFLLEKDDKYYCVYLFGYRVRAYLFWHQMLMDLASQLYMDCQVEPKDMNALVISNTSLDELQTSFSSDYKNPFENLEKELNDNLQQAKIQVQAAGTKIKGLESRLEADEVRGLDNLIQEFSYTTEGRSCITIFNKLKELTEKANQSQRHLLNIQ